APTGPARRSALQRVTSQRVVTVTEPKPAVVTTTDLFLLGFISLLSFCGFCFFDSLRKRQILSCVNRPRCSGLTRGSSRNCHQTNCDFRRKQLWRASWRRNADFNWQHRHSG